MTNKKVNRWKIIIPGVLAGAFLLVSVPLWLHRASMSIPKALTQTRMPNLAPVAVQLGILLVFTGFIVWLAIRAFRLMTKTRTLREREVSLREQVEYMESIRPAVEEEREAANAAVLRLAELLGAESIAVRQIADLRKLQLSSKHTAEELAEAGRGVAIMCAKARKEAYEINPQVRAIMRDIIKTFEQIIWTSVLAFVFLMDGFASLFEWLYYRTPSAFAASSIETRFDFFYFTMLTMTTIDVPPWTGLPVRAALALASILGIVFMIGILGSLLTVIFTRLPPES